MDLDKVGESGSEEEEEEMVRGKALNWMALKIECSV